MDWWKIVFVFAVFFVTISFGFGAEDGQVGDETSEENVRDLREYNAEGWRAVENIYPNSDGWLPQNQNANENQPTKRRRLRKRKRRPPQPSEESDEVASPTRRRVRPQRLDQIHEPWDEEMNDESIRRPYIRRRLTPVYDDIIITSENANPIGASIQFAPEETTVSSKTDLKALLKQSGSGLSLSEILQQKNLSLSELLMGNEKAISALTEKPLEITEATVEFDDSTKYKRLPPSIALQKVNRNFDQAEDSIESLSTKETLEAQRKRLAILHAHRDNKIYSDVTKFDVVTEPTTERRIFVPSHPKYYTSLDFKPDFGVQLTEAYDLEEVGTTTLKEISTTTTTSTTTEKPQQTTSIFNRLALRPKLKTNFKKLTTKANLIKAPAEEENYPKIGFTFKPITISVQDILATKDEPLRMSLDLNAAFTTTQQPPEKLKLITAKEEIMQILDDPKTKEKLARILQTRNMTVEELVEQRERGSSQLHLADIFHNKTREPEPTDEPFVGRMNSHFNSFPLFGRRQKSRPIPINLDLNPNKKEPTTIDAYTVTSFPTVKIELKENKQAPPFLWKQLYPDLFQEDNNTTETYLDNNNIETKFSSLSNLDLERKLSQDNDEELINLPVGVKSAIIASLAIIALSIIVFMTILMIFKWSQKRKTRLNYCSSFSSRFKSPILAGDQRKSLRTFMNETLGRKKNYYKSHLQSMSDNIWENDRKPSY